MKKSNNFIQVYKEPEKARNKARGILAKLWLQTMIDLGIKPTKLISLIEKYVDDPSNGVPVNGKNRSTERGNMMKQLTRPDMSWKVFLKAIRVLNPRYVRFEVHLGWRGQETIHSVKIPIAELKSEDMEELDNSGD